MTGEKTRFKTPPAGLPEHRESSINGWCASPDKVKWWRDVLESPNGQELVAIMRDQRAIDARLVAGSPEERLGRILGHDDFFRCLFVTMANEAKSVVRPKKPGQSTESVPPHPVQIP